MNNEISNRIKELRGDKTQADFAKEIGISFRAFRYYESGERFPPGDVIEKIAQVCNVSETFVLSGDNPVNMLDVALHLLLPQKTKEALNELSENIRTAVQGIKAERVAEQPGSYGADDVTLKILDMLKGMDDEARRDVLKYVEKEKLFAELKRDRKKAG